MSYELHHGDCLDILPSLRGVDAVVTDPPYHLTSIVKRFGGANAAPAQFGTDGAYARASLGFMGKEWDGGDIAFRAETWRLVYDAMKPGAHLAAFGGSRGYHRMACAIEDAGFEIRDSLMWLYSQGFPKSHNLDGEWQGWGSALKPAFEPIVLARKPLEGTIAANVLKHGVGAINIDGCRVGNSKRVPGYLSKTPNSIYGAGFSGHAQDGSESGHNPNIGRWPANVIHDGSDEVMAAFAAFGDRPGAVSNGRKGVKGVFEDGLGAMPQALGRGDGGSAARFFYCAKASKADRAGSKHPTVKPVSLMRWLCTLITPPGGTVLDPFSGSGTTLHAALDCGFRAIGIEREAEYVADIKRRMAERGVADAASPDAQMALPW